MKIKTSQTAITFTGISNESHLEDVQIIAKNAKCSCDISDYSTKAVIKGNLKQLNKFIKDWNNQ